jgi:excisionase family DNA binding protein
MHANTVPLVNPVGQIYTTDQVAAILQVSRRTVERLIARGDLQAIHIGRRLRGDGAPAGRLRVASGGGS